MTAATRFRLFNSAEHTSYDVLEEVKRGGEGRTFRAIQVGPHGRAHNVAVKVLTPEDYFSREADPRAILHRWIEQSQALRTAKHVGFAAAQAAFAVSAVPGDEGAMPAEWAGMPAIAIEWIEGEPLSAWARARGRSPLEALDVLADCASGLDALHNNTKYVHGDIKPSNIIVRDHRGVFIDYGLVRSFEQVRERSLAVGTDGYLDPAVIRGGNYTASSDHYALAATAFYVLTGRHPHRAPSRAWLVDVGREAGVPQTAKLISELLADPISLRTQHATATDLLAALRSRAERDAPPAPSGRPEAVSVSSETRKDTWRIPAGGQRPLDAPTRRLPPRAAPQPAAPASGLGLTLKVTAALFLATIAAFLLVALVR